MRELIEQELDLIAGGQDIVVVGRHPDNPYFPTPYDYPPGGTGSIPYYPYPGGSVYSYLYDYTNGPYDSYQKQVTVDLGRDPTQLEQQAIDFLKTVLANGNTLFNSDTFKQNSASDGNGNSITGQEVSNFFKNVDILVTTKTYDNGGVGEAHSRSGPQGHDVLLEISIAGLVQYMGNPSSNGDVLFPDLNEGLSWLTHEMAHVTQAGQNMNQAYHNGSVSWTANEQFAWSGGKAILEMAGLETFHPPGQGGYGDPFTVSN